MKCFYHNDLDGRAAAFCVYAWVGIKDSIDTIIVNKSTGIIENNGFIEINYGKAFPFDIIKPNEQVWIVDFSVSPDEMMRLLEITKEVTWIDHHKTAIEKYADFPNKINGIRKDGEAGCVLTWKYIHWYSDRCDPYPEDTWQQREEEMSKIIPVPHMIELVGDRDIWAWKFGDETRDFFNGSQIHNTSPSSDFWWKCMDHEIEPLPLPNTGNAEARKRGEAFWSQLLEAGRTINQYKKSTDESVNTSLGFETNFEGFQCWAINRGMVSSDRLGNRIDRYDILMPYSHDGKQFTVSLYSKKVDVSEIAKKHGGGGHKGASGFQCETLPFAVSEPPVTDTTDDGKQGQD